MSDTENIRMLTEIECVGMMLSKLIHDRQNKTKTSKMFFFKVELIQMCLIAHYVFKIIKFFFEHWLPDCNSDETIMDPDQSLDW